MKTNKRLQRHERKKFGDSEEWMANEFALRLLMPEETVRRLVDGGMTNIGDLAKEFGVPATAVAIRVEQLGYEIKD
jgi:Zn-dependent peptidase ImmA (M78 family)